jgi:hypothetical protein
MDVSGQLHVPEKQPRVPSVQEAASDPEPVWTLLNPAIQPVSSVTILTELSHVPCPEVLGKSI